jgi:hypothetical protein
MPKPKTTKSVEVGSVKSEGVEPKVKAPKPEYRLEVSVNDVVFKTEAKSLEAALTEFVQSPEFPVGAKTKLFIVYGKGDVTLKRLYQTPEARRMLTTIAIKPTAVTLLAEQLTRSLNQ